jgi:hypothetical protein
MVDIGCTMPFCMVVSKVSLWVSSMINAPSVPTNSIHVIEKLGYAGGKLQPAPITNETPLSMVTMMYCVSGTSAPVDAFIAP